MLDADEYVTGGLDKLKAYAAGESIADYLDNLKVYEPNEHVKPVEGVAGIIEEYSGKDLVNTYYRVRMWRNDGKWKFEGPGVHEVVTGGEVIFNSEIVVNHDHSHRVGAEQAVIDKFKRYVEILDTYLKDHPNDPRALFYLGRTYKDLNFPLLAVDAYQKYLDLDTDFRDERYQACLDAAACLKATGEYSRAREFAEKAVAIDARRAEAYNMLGWLQGFGTHSSAEDYFNQALACSIPNDIVLFLNPQEYDLIPKLGLAKCYETQKDFSMAEKIYTELSRGADVARVRARQRMKIFFMLGATPEPVYGGMIDQIGVGGVETTYIELPKEMRKLGHEVFLFCKCDKEHIHDDVYYIPYEKYSEYLAVAPDVVVVSRWFEALYFAYPKTPLKIIWLQDAYFKPPEQPDAFDIADKIICSSEWHRGYIAERYGNAVDMNKVSVIPLGIRKNLFAPAEKQQGRLIYSSNPDRGLYTLISVWDEIVGKCPGAELYIYYGWDGMLTWSDSPEWRDSVLRQKESVESFVSAHSDSVFLSGRLKKADLAREMCRADLCVYPCNFFETYCLTAAET